MKDRANIPFSGLVIGLIAGVVIWTLFGLLVFVLTKGAT